MAICAANNKAIISSSDTAVGTVERRFALRRMMWSNVKTSGVVFGLMLGGCMQSHGIRPLKPLELATAPYLDRIVEARTGSLMYEGGCLLFREDRSAALLMPVWPDGSMFNGTAVTFHNPAKADQRIIVGEEVVLRGQAVPWPMLTSAEYMPFRHQCGARPFFVSAVRPAN